MNREKLKVAFLSHRTDIEGGGEISLIQTLKHIDRNFIEPYLLVPGPGELSIHAEKLRIPVININMPSLKIRNFLKYIRSRKKLYQFLEETGIDIVYYNTQRSIMYGKNLLFKRMEIKHIWHCRVPIRQFIIDRIMTSGLDGIIATSEFTAKRFAKRSNKTPIRVIYNGIDPSEFRRNNLKVRKDHFISENGLQNKKVIGTAAFLSERKNIEWMLSVIYEIRKELNGIIFIIAGKDSDERNRYLLRLKNCVKELDLAPNVIFLDHIEDMAAFYACLDLYIHAARDEAFGRTLIEAMAIGIPVLAPNWQVYPEIINKYNKGHLLQPDNKFKMDRIEIDNFPPSQAAKAILKILSDKQSYSARAVFPEKFMIKNHIRFIEQFMKDLTSKKTIPTEICQEPILIAIDIREFKRSTTTGIRRMLERQLNYIEEKRPEWTIILIGDEETEFPELRNRTERIIIPHRSRLFIELFILPRLLRRKKIHSYYSPYYKIPLTGSFKKISTLHDLTPIVTAHGFKRIVQGLLFSLWIPLHIKKADVIFTDSNFSKTDIISRYNTIDEARISVVYPPFMPLPCGHLSKNQREDILKAYDLEGFKYLLFIGGGKKHKNLHLLTEIFPELLMRIEKNLLLAAVGRWNDSDREKYTDYNFLRLVDNPDDSVLECLYRKAQALVVPSLYEGFGYPPLEAMSAGIPVISSNGGSLPEVCGKAALYFDPLDPCSAIDPIIRVLNDVELKAGIISEGQKQLRNFSASESLDRFIQEVIKITEK